MDDRRDYIQQWVTIDSGAGLALAQWACPAGMDARVIHASANSSKAGGVANGNWLFYAVIGGSTNRISPLLVVGAGIYTFLYTDSPCKESYILHAGDSIAFNSEALAAGEHNYMILCVELRKGVQPYGA
jgi:hypothetical protein